MGSLFHDGPRMTGEGHQEAIAYYCEWFTAVYRTRRALTTIVIWAFLENGYLGIEGALLSNNF